MAHHTASAVSEPARILIVDDEPSVAQGLKWLLEVLGHSVRVAKTGNAALSEARAHVPDVMLVDIHLPDMDGYEIARCVHAESALRDVVLVSLTGYAGPEDAQRSLAAGFHHHFVKPVDVDVLESLLVNAGAARTPVGGTEPSSSAP